MRNKLFATLVTSLFMLTATCVPALARPMYVTNDIGLNVRVMAGTDKEKVGTLDYGDKVETIFTVKNPSDGRQWSYIEYNGEIRVVCAEFLSSEEPEPKPENTETETSVVRSLGPCVVTHYCNCSACCGQWAGGATASGAMPQAGVTVAADPGIPFGTKVMINGNVYTVQDRGVYGNAIDIYCSSHSEALNRGMYSAEVFIVE